MPLSNHKTSYVDCRARLDEAMDAERGIAIVFNTSGQGVNFRMRCYKLFQLTRQDSMKTFPEDDPRYGRCVYEGLIIRAPELREDGRWDMKIEKREKVEMEVREL